jgi:hypothetical protein
MRHLVRRADAKTGLRVDGCSECGWVYSTPNPPVGKTMHEIEQEHYRRVNAAFIQHSCDTIPKSKENQ